MVPGLSLSTEPERNKATVPMENFTQTENFPEEVQKLREELYKRDLTVKRIQEELRRTKCQLNDIAKRQKIFYQFKFLPRKLREIVYGKLTMFDRVSAAKASKEMESYFVENRLEGSNTIYLKEENGKQYVKVVYKVRDGWHTVSYTEMHMVPEHMLPIIQYELESSARCKCKFCRDTIGIHREGETVRYFHAENLDALFHTMRLLRSIQVELKSSPFGGLVDLVQPMDKCVSGGRSGFICWHPKKCDYSNSHDPRVNMENWRIWFEYFSIREFYFSNDSSRVYIHRDLFDLQVIKSAFTFQSDCHADVNFHQLMQMEAWSVKFDRNLNSVTPLDMLKIYKARIQEWMNGEKDILDYHFDWTQNSDNPPHMDYRQLFADVKDYLKPDEFRVYANSPSFAFFCTRGEIEESITIRNMKTNVCLDVTANRLVTGDYVDVHEDEEFPEEEEYLRF